MRTSLKIDTKEWPEMWQAAYRILEQTIVPNQLQAWIQPLEFVDSQAGEKGIKIRLAAPNDFSANWVRDKLLKLMEAAFNQVMGTPCEVQIIVSASAGEQDFSVAHTHVETAQTGVSSKSTYSGFGSESASASGMVLQTGNRGVYESGLDPRYIFDTFVVGASNQFAHASAVAVAEHPARQYNPLFLYSPPGLGKTHLLHAIGNHLLATRPNSRVAYLSAEKFVNEMIEAIQLRRMSQFRAKYRDSYDMILIDDIQFIAGKGASEEEFFHTFNELYSSKRQIVLSCDRPPKEIEKLEERLRTRFEWGLLADITVPEIETRIAILKAKAERDDIYLPDEVATFLASHIKTNVRELEGVLIRLQAQASLSGAEISLEMAKHELKSAAPEEGAHFTIESIQGAVAKHFHLKLGELKAATRVQNIALPRQIAMYLIRKYTGLGYKEIGRFFGGKDHSTIMHGCKKVESEMESNALIRDAVEAIQNSL
jgi:chromosomal replication initiator protein